MSEVIALARERSFLLLSAAVLAASILYLVGIDQGHMLALVQGQIAFDVNLLHEVFHDARHAAGFPCH